MATNEMASMFMLVIVMHLGKYYVSGVITDVRLVGGPGPNLGTVEIRQDSGTWETTCGINLDINDVNVICNQLGFTGASRAITDTPYEHNSNPKTGLNCNGDEANLSECTLISTPFCSRVGSATCYDIRLIGGPTPDRGTVEIRHENGTWESICGEHINLNEVSVICRYLGFAGPNKVIKDTPYDYYLRPTLDFHCDWHREDDRLLSDCRATSPSTCSSVGAVSCYGDGYIGCFIDSTSDDRALPGDIIVDNPDMTISYCIQHCKESTQGNYTYAGVALYDECYCGEASDDYARFGKVHPGDCRLPCRGDPITENCGGLGYTLVFNIIQSPVIISATSTTVAANTATTTVSISSIATSTPVISSDPRYSNETNTLVLGIMFGLAVFYGIIMTLIYLHMRFSKKAGSRKPVHELDPYTAIDVNHVHQPAYEYIEPTGTDSRSTDGNRVATYENQRVAE